MTLFLFVLISLALVKIYIPWFTHPDIIGGDWPYYVSDFIHTQRLFPSLWSTYRDIGGGITAVLNLDTLQSFWIVLFVQILHIPWQVVYKVAWYGIFICLSIISSYSLSKYVFKQSEDAAFRYLSVLIFLTNTYILMVVGGGQMGVALAYAATPLTLGTFIQLVECLTRKEVGKRSIEAGMALALVFFLDPRVAYIVLVAVSVYVFLHVFHWRISIKALVFIYVLPLLITFFINAFWIFPLLLLRFNPLEQYGSAYTSVIALRFFSLTDISHSLSLLHPNWPENIFGKTYFLQPEFLLIPILAFGSLLFREKKILFFSLLAIIGTFLAKGSNAPLGSIYVWLFEHFPGFVMFRDSTKFYQLIVISYAILIPFTIREMSKSISLHIHFFSKKSIIVIACLTFLFYWCLTIRQSLTGQLKGTFSSSEVPIEYRELESFFSRQSEHFRTLWLPTMSRFAYVSDVHPAFPGNSFFSATSSAELIAGLDNPGNRKKLSDLSVKYIIIPSDPLGEIFINDRKYDSSSRLQFERSLDTLPWLNKISADKISIYQTDHWSDHFWVLSGEKLTYLMLSPDKYRIHLSNDSPEVLYFSEHYNPGWVAKIGSTIIPTTRTETGLNSFSLPSGDFDIDIYFEPEKYAVRGRIVSFVALMIIIISYFLLRKQQYE